MTSRTVVLGMQHRASVLLVFHITSQTASCAVCNNVQKFVIDKPTH